MKKPTRLAADSGLADVARAAGALDTSVREFVWLPSEESLSKDAVYVPSAEHLASFKVPKDIVFADALPRNPSGKLLNRELRQKHTSLFAH